MTVPTLTACAGFLLAVLWMDLIIDTQIGLRPGRVEPDELALIAGYYRRATTTSRPMSGLIVLVMGILLAALAVISVTGRHPVWLLAISAPLAAGPIALALLRTVPNAVRLGRGSDTPAGQIQLARAIYRDHILCAAALSAFLLLWLIEG